MKRKRTKFAVVGTHPLLDLIREHLILDGYVLVGEGGSEEEPDFMLVGADVADKDLASNLVQLCSIYSFIPDIPTLVLSTSEVYCDRDDRLHVSDNKPMSEDRASVVPSSLDPNASRGLYALLVENLFLSSRKHVMILRIFDLYGSEIKEGLIPSFVDKAKKREEITIHAPGYQTRCFLHMEDFWVCIDRVIPKMLKGARGIYNVGATEEISLKRLADSVWQLTTGQSGGTPLKMINPPTRQVWWRQPDITRIKALINWKPKLTLRKGLWRYVNEVK